MECQGRKGGGWSIDVKRIATTEGVSRERVSTKVAFLVAQIYVRPRLAFDIGGPEFLLPVMCKGGKISFVSPGR